MSGACEPHYVLEHQSGVRSGEPEPDSTGWGELQAKACIEGGSENDGSRKARRAVTDFSVRSDGVLCLVA